MAWIFVDKDDEGGSGDRLRSHMRRSMRGGGYRHHHIGDESEYERGYRYGYKHGWEDSDDDGMDYRRSRDSRGRFI